MAEGLLMVDQRPLQQGCRSMLPGCREPGMGALAIRGCRPLARQHSGLGASVSGSPGTSGSGFLGSSAFLGSAASASGSSSTGSNSSAFLGACSAAALAGAGCSGGGGSPRRVAQAAPLQAFSAAPPTGSVHVNFLDGPRSEIPGIRMLKDSGVQLPWVPLVKDEADLRALTQARARAARPPAPGWSEEMERTLRWYWISRGVSNPAQLERHIALARENPYHRDVAWVRRRMARWDKVLEVAPEADVNRIVRHDGTIMALPPRDWLRRLAQLQARDPEVNWARVLEECPPLGFLTAHQFATALNDWVARLNR